MSFMSEVCGLSLQKQDVFVAKLKPGSNVQNQDFFIIQMGLCANGGDAAKTSNSYFQQEPQVEFKTDIFAPSHSSVFNTLRKTSELVVLHPQNKTSNQMFTNTIDINFDTAKPNHLKTLINFKKLLLIGNYQQYKQTIIKQIKSYTNCSRFYLLSESFCHSFLQQFPLFKSSTWQSSKLATSQVPILVIDSRDIVEHSGSHFKVYIHASNKKDMKIYNLLGISDENCVIKEPNNIPVQRVKQYYFTALSKNSSKNIVLLHSAQIDSTTLSEIFTNFLKEKYGIPTPYINIYLGKSLPKTNMQQPTQATQEIAKANQVTQSPVKNQIQKFKALFQQLESEQGGQKTQRAFNLLNTLITNIYSHQNEDMYRKVKRTNKQINQLLSKCRPGRALLDQLGFRQQGENWVNTVQSKYLKIFKTDFDLGYKQYKTRQSNS